MIFSKIFDKDDKRAIGRWFSWRLWSLPGFGIERIEAFFQSMGKLKFLRHSLITLVRERMNFSSRYFNVVFLIKLVP